MRKAWLPRLDLNPVNIAILCFLIVGGVLGYARFPEFKEVAASSQAIANPLISIPFLFTFCVLVVLNKTGEGFPSFGAAFIPSLLSTIILSAIGFLTFGLFNIAQLSLRNVLGYVIASLTGTAALLLVAQSWFKVPVAVRPTVVALAGVRESLRLVQSAAKADGSALRELRLKTAAFLTSAESLVENPDADATIRQRLQHIIDAAKNLQKLFEAPDDSEVRRRLGNVQLRDFAI